MEDDPAFIPAATIQDVDLSGVSPATATEIRRLGELMECGEETPEQFARLVRLLHEAGFRAKSEYLLRRNMETVADAALYRELYGTEKPDEFAAAIAAFARQFSVGLLELVEERGFLDRVCRTAPRLARFDEFQLLSEPCEVHFDYASEDAVEADVSSLAADQLIVLRWINGVWELA